MSTVLDIITRSMLVAGIITKAETPSSDEATDAMEALNGILGSWSNDSNFIVSRTVESFPLTGAASYTIGTGGNFNTTRPIDIASVYLRSGSVDYPALSRTDEDFGAIPQKDISSRPIYYNYTNSFPLGVIKVYPVGDASYTIFIISEKPFAEFTALTDVVNFQPGVKRALVYNLAMELAPEYGVDVPASVADIARKSIMFINKAVIKNRPLDAHAKSGTNNIYTGWI